MPRSLASRRRRRAVGKPLRLTSAGEDFRPIIEQMSAWGQRWTQSIAPEELDPALLMFGARRQIDLAALPAGRTVIRFEFRGVPKVKAKQRYWWLVIQRPETEVCLKIPGFEVDAVVTADLATFTRLVLGYVGLREVLGRRLVAFSGSEAAIALLCRLLQLPQQPMQKTFRFSPICGCAGSPEGIGGDSTDRGRGLKDRQPARHLALAVRSRPRLSLRTDRDENPTEPSTEGRSPTPRPLSRPAVFSRSPPDRRARRDRSRIRDPNRVRASSGEDPEACRKRLL